MTAGLGAGDADRDGDARIAADRRVKEIFERVLDAPREERDAILARECGSDEIRDEVTALLRLEEEPGDFLEVPAGHHLLGAPENEVRLSPGDEVADFTVLGVLGVGGGGVVYDADQREPKRRVALKMIRVRARTHDALRAFRDEAANLARLHHAAIAHVYAAGVREHAGRAEPWIAMERIDGARSIVRHARDAGLGRDERLRLFVEVCAALHHAHENGVIHRDVTPGNVLVDAEGRPKVVDFGVSCGVADGDDAAADAVGTLAYASPEQLTADRRRVDRRADVYGLGAVLYELLTGEVPLEVDDAPVADIARIKRTTPVRAPSALAPGVPPDLDAIVLRALAPDPGARYESAAAFGADVARFLANEPVAAFAGGTAYQLGKFVRRRRAAAFAISSVAVALVLGAGVSLWFAIENAAARDLADRRSYVAEIAAAAAALRVDDIAEARRRLDRAPAGLRDWEWRHLVSRLDGSRATVRFPSRELWDGTVSADGALIAVTGLDRSQPESRRFAALARADGTIVREWPTDGRNVPTAAVSADGTRYVAGFDDGSVLLLDVAAGREIGPLAPHAARVVDVVFDAASEHFATGSADRSARLWSATDGALLRTFEGNSDFVIGVALDATGARLATGCRDGSIRVWDTATGVLFRTLTGHEGSVEAVSFSSAGDRLASVSRDRTARLWNVEDGSAIAVGRSHTSNVRSVAFHPGGGAFVSASWDGTLRVWDAASGAETGILRGHGGPVTSVGFTGSEPWIASYSLDGTVKLWDRGSADVASCGDLREQVESLDFDPDGALLVAAGHDGRLSILDARTARVTSQVQASGRSLVAARFVGPGAIVVLTQDSELQVWEIASDGRALTCARHIALVETWYGALCVDRRSGIAWLGQSPSQTWVTGFDLQGRKEPDIRRAPIGTQAVACDGRGGLAVGSRDGRVARASAGGDWITAQFGDRIVRSVAFDETGQRIVAAFEGGTVRVLRASDLATLLVLEGHSSDAYQAEFLPGGRRIATVSRDHTVRLWDAADGENVLVLHEHGYPVTCLAVSPDGSRIATAAGTYGEVQATIKVWAAPATPR